MGEEFKQSHGLAKTVDRCAAEKNGTTIRSKNVQNQNAIVCGSVYLFIKPGEVVIVDK
jgi:hypothetical protein